MVDAGQLDQLDGVAGGGRGRGVGAALLHRHPGVGVAVDQELGDAQGQAGQGEASR